MCLRFFSGSWEAFNIQGKYDIVLSSETIYRTDSLGSLITLMRNACGSVHSSYLCLVAAKLLYFGVGGGVSEFVRAVEGQQRGVVYTVWDCEVGVRRRIMRVEWEM